LVYGFLIFPLPSEGEGWGKGDIFTPTLILPPQGVGNERKIIDYKIKF